MSHSRDCPGVTAPLRTNIVLLTAVWNPTPFCYSPIKIRKSVMSIKFPPAILGPEMAAPILWAPGIFWFFLLEKPHAHKIPPFRGGRGFFGREGWKCQFYFYGRGDFSEKVPDIRTKLIKRVLFLARLRSWGWGSLPSFHFTIKMVFSRCALGAPSKIALSVGGKRGAELRVEEKIPFFEIFFAACICKLVGFAAPPGRPS